MEPISKERKMELTNRLSEAFPDDNDLWDLLRILLEKYEEMLNDQSES